MQFQLNLRKGFRMPIVRNNPNDQQTPTDAPIPAWIAVRPDWDDPDQRTIYHAGVVLSMGDDYALVEYYNTAMPNTPHRWSFPLWRLGTRTDAARIDAMHSLSLKVA